MFRGAITSKAALRARLQLAVVSTYAAAMVLFVTFLVTVVGLSPAQSATFLGSIAAYGLACVALVPFLAARCDAPVARALDAGITARPLSEAAARPVLAAVLALPRRLVALHLGAWVGAGIWVPLWLHLRHPDTPASAGITIALACSFGGCLVGTLGFFLVRRVLTPLRLALAIGATGNEFGRDTRLVPLAAKTRGALFAATATTLVFASLLAHHALERTQESRDVERLRRLLDAPARAAATIDPSLGAALTEGLDADAGPLTPIEREWITEAGAASGDSLGLTSRHAFAWRLEGGRIRIASLALPNAWAALAGERAPLLLMLGFLLAASLSIGELLAADVRRSFFALRGQAERIAAGDLAAAPAYDDDESGDAFRSFDRMRRSLSGIVAQATQQGTALSGSVAALRATGDEVAASAKSQEHSLEQAARSVTRIHEEIASVVQASQEVAVRIENVAAASREVSEGGELLAERSAELAKQVDEAHASTARLVAGTAEVHETSQRLSDSAAATALESTRVAAGMTAMEGRAESIRGLSRGVVELAEEGRARVGAASDELDRIAREMEHAVALTERLADQGSRIHSALRIIEEVADQTQLLALNAAIIAARAGSEGTAFTVIAGEIKALARRVMEHTGTIEAAAGTLGAQGEEATRIMRQTADRTAAGKAAGAAASEVLRRITEAAGVTLDHVEEISNAVAAQAGAARSLAESMSGIHELGERCRERSEEQLRACSVVEETHAIVESMSHDALATTREQGEAVRGIHASVDAVRGELERVRASLETQSASCREVASLLSDVYARTHAGSAASETLRDAAAELATRTEALRVSVSAFTAGADGQATSIPN